MFKNLSDKPIGATKQANKCGKRKNLAEKCVEQRHLSLKVHLQLTEDQSYRL